MRLIWMASVGILVASTAPGMARDYPWCLREPGTGGSLQCRFTSSEQCQAAASGLGGGCSLNPASGAGQPPGLQSSSVQDGPPGDPAPRRRPHRVKHQPGKHGWYYE